MGEHTGISWCHHTFNLWWGCVEVSPACDHCYAATFAKRTGHQVWGADSPRRFFKEPHYLQPLTWNARAEAARERRRVFCGSMMDIAERHHDELIDVQMLARCVQLFSEIIPATPWLDWLLLTKRPWNLIEVVPEVWNIFGWPANVWPGTTAENQAWYDMRVKSLMRTKAATRFISYEPALGGVDFKLAQFDVAWIIAGGESGHGFRQADDDWYRSARDQCQQHGRAFWFKQHSALHPKLLGDKLDGVQYHQLPSGHR